MSVIINELEHLPSAAESHATERSGVDSTGSTRNGQKGDAQAQVMQVIRREASRQARLWAD
jgi:hypothetical protein